MSSLLAAWLESAFEALWQAPIWQSPTETLNMQALQAEYTSWHRRCATTWTIRPTRSSGRTDKLPERLLRLSCTAGAGQWRRWVVRHLDRNEATPQWPVAKQSNSQGSKGRHRRCKAR